MRTIIILSCLVMLFSACSSSNAPVQASPSPKFTTRQPTGVEDHPTATASATVEISRTRAATLTQIPTGTRTETIFPTFTPYPIAKLNDKQKMAMMDILAQQPGCELPCWNGLTPGISRKEEIPGFFARLGVDVGPISAEDSGVVAAWINNHPSESHRLNDFPVEVVYQDQIVDTIRLWYSSYPEQYTITRLKYLLGYPDSILEYPQQGNSYRIAFVYNKQKTIVDFLGLYLNNYDTVYRRKICLDYHVGQDVSINLYSSIDDPVDWGGERYFDDDAWIKFGEYVGITSEKMTSDIFDKRKCVIVQ